MEKINKFSSLTGRIIGVNCYGCYVKDDENDITVFYYGSGRIGDRVFLSVCKVDTYMD